MFIDALFTVAEKWNQPRHPSIDELIKKTQSIDTKDFYSAVKKKEIITFARELTKPEIILLHEIRQTNNFAYFLSEVDPGLMYVKLERRALKGGRDINRRRATEYM